MRLSAGATILLLLGLVQAGWAALGSASAQDVAAYQDCATLADKREAAGDAIGACGRALDAGRLNKAALASVYGKRAQAWSNVEQYGRAIDDDTAAIKLVPKEAWPYLSRGWHYRLKGDLDAALADFNQAIKLHPRNPEGYFRRSLLAGARGDLAAELADLDRTLDINPAYRAALNNRCYYRLKAHADLKAALADCDMALRLSPADANTLHSRCAVKSAMGDYDGAIVDCNAVLEKGPKIPALVDRGGAREKLGRADLAQADYAAALAIKPEGAEEEGFITRAKERLAALANGSGGAAEPATAAATSATSAPQPSLAVASAQPAPAALPAAVPPVAAAPMGRRIALVIGNSRYSNVPALPNPVRDAGVIAEQFRRAGFAQVTLADDLGRDAFNEALRKFAVQAESADWAVVYYAGHGIEVGGLNYLIPVDAKLATDRAVQFETVPLEQAMAAVEGARKLRLVILDACRDNPFAQQMTRTTASRSIGRGMANVEPDAGTLVVYSAKHGQIALDGDDGNSPFVTALAKRMMTPGLDVRRMFDYVRDDVMAATQRHQQPFSYGSLPGSEDFTFVAAP